MAKKESKFLISRSYEESEKRQRKENLTLMTCDLNSSGDDSRNTSGTNISSTLPVARSSSNSAGFMAISGTNPRDEKYGTASQALP